MEITPSAAFGKAGEYAQMLDDVKEDPAVKKAEQQVDGYQKECDRLDTLIKLPRQERFNQSGDLYDDTLKEVGSTHIHTMGPLVITGTLGLGAASLCALMATNVMGPQAPGLLAIGLLVFMFNKHGFPSLYTKALKKWVLPKKIDKKLLETYKEQSTEAHGHLDRAKQSLETLASKKLKALAEQRKTAADNRPQVTEMEEEPDYLMIDNLKLAKQKHLAGEIVVTQDQSSS
jgi:hypothetical protein